VSLDERLRSRASELGLHAVGVSRAGTLGEEADRFDRWVSSGRHGDMRYLERWGEVRRDPRHEGMVAGARSVVSVALAYPPDGAPAGLATHLARYARGPDYHRVVRGLLAELLASLRRDEPSCRGRALVDSAPVLERAWAERAGLGWIGRNTCLIHPRLGSWLVLGELVITADLEPGSPIEDGCGDCRACVDACPVGALERPDGRVLDARRCLSYWTVEAGARELPADIEASLVLFGCDACQQVCPHNQEVPRSETPLGPLRRWEGFTLEGFAKADLAAIERLIEGTALERAGAPVLRERARRLLEL